MSEVESVIVPPPPPPPRPSALAFDFVRPLAFTFEDPEWIQKVLLGGLFTLASFLLVGIPFLYGYLARLTRNVVEGLEHPLPDWDNLGDYFVEGLSLLAIGLVYATPVIFLVGMLVFPSVIMQMTESDALKTAGGLISGCVWCLMFPISLAMAVWMPAALLNAVVTGRFAAAFDFARIAAFIRANVGNYILAYVVWLIARFVAPFGLVLFCVGVVFTMFWSFVVAAYAFGQVYRLSLSR